MRTVIAVPMLVLAGLLSACAGSSQLKAPADYPELTLMADEPNTLFFAKPELQIGRYSKVHIAPVAVQLRKDTQTVDVTDEEGKRLARYAENALKRNFPRSMTLVPAPGEDVLSVHFRIIDLVPTNTAQVAMMMPPFSLINLASPKGLFMGSITLAGELYEGVTEEPSVAFVAFRSRPGVDAASAFGKWTAAEKIIDNAAERLANDIEKERNATR